MRVAVALLALLVATGCGSSPEEGAQPQQTTTVAESPMPMAGSNREAAPPLAGESLSGDPIALGDFRGRQVLINVWSSW